MASSVMTPTIDSTSGSVMRDAKEIYRSKNCSIGSSLTLTYRGGSGKKEKFTLFSDHNGSLLRRQPGGMDQAMDW